MWNLSYISVFLLIKPIIFRPNCISFLHKHGAGCEVIVSIPCECTWVVFTYKHKMGFCQLKNAHTFEDNELLVVKLKFLFLQSLRDEWDQIQAQLHRQLLWTIRILGVTYFSFLLCFFLYAHPLYVSHALRLRPLFVTAFG